MDTLRDNPMDALQAVIDLFTIWGNNFKRNLFGMWTGMDATRWFRLVAVVGVYMVFRNFIVKKAEAKQAREHAKAMEPEITGKVTANALRAGTTGKKVSFEESSEEGDDETKATGMEWGKKAKKRQKQLEKKQLEAEELKRRAEEGDAEDKDIMDLLVDYEKGKDGW